MSFLNSESLLLERVRAASAIWRGSIFGVCFVLMRGWLETFPLDKPCFSLWRDINITRLIVRGPYQSGDALLAAAPTCGYSSPFGISTRVVYFCPLLFSRRVPSHACMHPRCNVYAFSRCYYAPVRPSGGIKILYDSSSAKKKNSFSDVWPCLWKWADTFTINKLFSCVSNADSVVRFYLLPSSLSFWHGRLQFFMYPPQLYPHSFSGSIGSSR